MKRGSPGGKRRIERDIRRVGVTSWLLVDVAGNRLGLHHEAAHLRLLSCHARRHALHVQALLMNLVEPPQLLSGENLGGALAHPPA